MYPAEAVAAASVNNIYNTGCNKDFNEEKAILHGLFNN